MIKKREMITFIINQKINRWTVIEKNEPGYWSCKCECGNVRKIRGDSLKHGKSKSCGCLQKEIVSILSTIHGKHNTRIYKTWQNMKSRCNNPKTSKYHIYGGKGIKVCDEWLNSFQKFYEWGMANGYTNKLTLDRIDGNEDYQPENCRWATYKEQNNNTTQNHSITFNGETHNLCQWPEIIGVSNKCLSERIRRNWSIERALTTPTIDNHNFGDYMKEWKEGKHV